MNKLNTAALGKFIKGTILGIVPIAVVILKQHGCEVDNWKELLRDLALALIPGFGHALWFYYTNGKRAK